MAKRTLSKIQREILVAENNLSLAKSDYQDVKKAYKGYPILLKELSGKVETLKREELAFRNATRKEQNAWKSAGDPQDEVELWGTSKLFMKAVDKA